MRIAIDLDGVVFHFVPLLLKLVKETTHQTNIVEEDVKWCGWNILQYIGFDDDEAEKLMLDYTLHGCYLDAELIFGARYIIRKLHYVDNHDIIFITSRPSIAIFDTYHALDKAGFGAFEVHFSDKENTKAKIVNRLGCDMLIEDRWDYLKETKDLNPHVVTVLFNDENQLLPPTGWKPDHYFEDWYKLYSDLKL